jgi:hypothetical protein
MDSLIEERVTMVYRGHVKNGMIQADEPIELPEGAAVRFEIAPGSERHADSTLSFGERFSEVMGKAQTLPEDAAENHDHYLYGMPKK